MIIDVLSHQEKFIFSNAKHTGLIGGYGSGKTYAGVLKTTLKKLAYPGIDVAYYLPTYGLIRDIAFPKFRDLFDQFGIPYELHESAKEFHTPYGDIKLRSMDNPASIIGYEVGYSLVDETDILPTDKMTTVFAMVLGRNRSLLPNGDRNCTDVVGTPEGFKWAYNFFVKEAKEGRQLIKGRTKDNPFLPPNYIEDLKDTYTPEQLEAYLNGEFVNLTTGTVYKKYDRIKNRTSRTVQPSDALHVGMDFNITKMNAVIHVQDTQFKYAVDEIVNAYDTDEVCAILKRRYPSHKIIVYPDAAGKARSTSGKSDHEIIKSYGFTIRSGNTNPPVKDRVNKMNISFCDKDGNRTYLVNDEQCPTYSEALERQTYKNGEPDKSTGFDHITEAGGYFVFNCNIAKMSYKIS
jgi:phage terminase large subunit